MTDKISVEYSNQKTWRNWREYMNKLPISSSHKILDIGCGTGDVSLLLSEKAKRVVAVDRVEELIQFAIDHNSASNINYVKGDLSKLTGFGTEVFDGIWSSFGIAYFTDLENTIRSWAKLLKPEGWLAIVEVNDMFAHEPLSEKSRKLIKSYYQRQKDNCTYNFLSGEDLRTTLEKVGFEIVHDLKMRDRELVFDGTAPLEIIQTWESRLNRMIVLQKFLGEDNFKSFRKEFIDSIKSEFHKCNAEIFFIVVKKTKYNNDS